MRKTVRKAILSLAVITIATAACAVDVQQEKLGRMPAAVLDSEQDAQIWNDQFLKEAQKSGFSVEVAPCTEAAYGRHLGAVVPKEGGKCCVWLDGKEGPVYDQVRGAVKGAYKTREFRFSHDGRRLAYTARKGDKWVMVVDGKEGPVFDGLREPFFSMDSKRVCYVGFRGKDCILVMDGKECGPYPGIEMAFPYFSAKTPVRVVEDTYCPVFFGPDNHFAFVASMGRDKNGNDREKAVIDGRETSEYENVGWVEFSPDGSRVAFSAKKGDKAFVVLDSKVGPKYDEVDAYLTFSPDGKRLAYVATRYKSNGDPESFVVVDGKEGPKFMYVLASSIAFSADSTHITYTATPDDENYCVVVDGKPGKFYDEVGGYGSSICQSYGPDGTLYYKAMRGEKYYTVIDNTPSPAYDDIEKPLPIFSPDGKHYAYAARQGERSFVVMDGVKGPEYDNIHHDTLTFTGDGRLVYRATKLGPSGDWVAVIDGKEHLNMWGMTFSPDGKHLAHFSENKDWINKITAVYDGQELGKFEEVLPMHFAEDGTLDFLAVRDETKGNKMNKFLYRVTVKP